MDMPSDPKERVFVPDGPDRIASLVETYRATGVAALPGFLDEREIAQLCAEATRLQQAAERSGIDSKMLARRPTVDGGTRFERIDPVRPCSETFAALARDERLLEAGKAILGTDAPALMKDKLIYKFPRDRGYLLHQDFPYFSGAENAPGKFMTAAIPLDPITRENGGLSFFLGCHDRVQPAPQSDPRDVDPAAMEGIPAWDGVAPAGTLILFHSLTPHESGPNHSDGPRRIVYYTYVTPDLSHISAAYYAERQKDL